uniref:Protein kinase domain-containing protein n=1 Tax=viral metagenome TaxID=1070528 RepID=A0A6C0J0U4_9ZZZZ
MIESNKIPKFTIHYSKHKPINLNNLEKTCISSLTLEDNENEYNPFFIESMQSYNPIYNNWFSLDNSNFNRITLNHNLHMIDMNTVINYNDNTIINKPIFIKYSPLLDPVRYMVGKYESHKDILTILPSLENDLTYSKIKDSNNMAYVDCFFSYLSNQLLTTHSFLNGIEFYGSFVGIQKKHKMDITDDYEYLQSSPFFIANNKKLFNISNITNDLFYNYGSHGNKPKLTVLNTPKHNISAVNLDSNEINTPPILLENITSLDNELIYNNAKNTNGSRTSCHSSTDSDTDSDSDSDNSNISISTIDNENENENEDEDENDSNWETDEDEDDNCSSIDNDNYFAYINNFPVQAIALQKCDGTIDTLLENKLLSFDENISALMQISMTLLVYQKTFRFTHNDLHTNNIMYINTEQEFIYYKYKLITYKVPTFGKIYKIIDFGRAIYNYNGLRLCSDSFAPNGDASTQYNCEPYMDENKPRLDPNFSFDLCRLGCSLYDFVIEDEENPDNFNELQKLVLNWCTDDNNKNILYKKNGDERYPNFKLYKMIARTVHNNTPEDQLKKDIFKQYIYKDTIIPNQFIINIDELPEYYTKYV